MTWTGQWVEAANAAEERAAREKCPRCHTQKVLGYSNLGIPTTCCPNCSPDMLGSKRTVGEAWGFSEC